MICHTFGLACSRLKGRGGTKSGYPSGAFGNTRVNLQNDGALVEIANINGGLGLHLEKRSKPGNKVTLVETSKIRKVWA